MNRAIFLDRDNTLIHNDGDLGDPSAVKLIQGAASAIASMQGLGYRVVVVTNQGGVARGKYTEADVEAVNSKVAELVKGISGATIDRFYYCPYHPEATVEQYRRDHPWRKPQPGMILQALKDLGLDPAQCWMIGDQDRDMQAGAAAGVRTILLRPDAGAQPPLRQSGAAQMLIKPADRAQGLPDFVARNLIEAVRVVAQQRLPEGLDKVRLNAAATRRESATVPHEHSKPAETGAASTSSLAAVATGAHAETAPAVATALTAVKPAPPRPITPTVAIPTSRGLAADRPDTTAGPAATPREAPPTPEPAPATPSIPDSLRQILQELRSHRRVTADLSYQGVLAIAMQMIAAVCLLGALWMGLGNSDAFLRWLGVALFMQLVTITLLLFRH